MGAYKLIFSVIFPLLEYFQLDDFRSTIQFHNLCGVFKELILEGPPIILQGAAIFFHKNPWGEIVVASGPEVCHKPLEHTRFFIIFQPQS